jgi:hypothetical protein
MATVPTYVHELEQRVDELENLLGHLSKRHEDLQNRYALLDEYSKQWCAFLKADNSYINYTQFEYHTIKAASLCNMLRKLGCWRKKSETLALTIGKRGVPCWHVIFVKVRDKKTRDIWTYELTIFGDKDVTPLPRKYVKTGEVSWRQIIAWAKKRWLNRDGVLP